MFTTPEAIRNARVVYSPDEPVGGPAAVPAAPAAPAVPATPEPAAVPAAPAVPATPAAPVAPVVPEPVDYGAKVTEWGGDERIERALKIDAALDTTEGQEALVIEHLRARGFDNAQIEAFLRPQPAPGTPAVESVEQLLADPERVLTAAELSRVLTARDEQSQARQTQEAALNAARTAIDTTMTELAVPEENRQTILTLADRFLPTPGIVPSDNPAAIAAAIRAGAAEFDRQVQEAAKNYVEGKGAAHAAVPTPLPAGGTGGGEATPEPQNLQEASARARAAILGQG